MSTRQHPRLAPVCEVERPSVRLELDARHFPVLTATWAGMVTTEILDRYFEARAPYLRHAEALGLRTVVVTDMSLQEAPNSVIRRYIAEQGKLIDPDFPSLLGYVVVVPSRVLRGMVTAIQWVIGDMWVELRQTPSLADAYRVAGQIYRDAGLVAPPMPPEPPAGVGLLDG